MEIGKTGNGSRLPNPRLTPFTGEERLGFPDGDPGEDPLIRSLRIGVVSVIADPLPGSYPKSLYPS
jgi:hypothetical protein